MGKAGGWGLTRMAYSGDPAMLYALTGEYIFGKAGTMCGKLRWEMSVLGFLKILEFRFFLSKN